MKRSGSKRYLFAMTVISLLLALAMPATSFGKDRGRNGRGRDNRRWKCGKFVNCHDARDGRWDGRGPRRNRLDSLARWRRARLRNRNRNFNNRLIFRNLQNRDRDFDRNDFWRTRQRRFGPDRDFNRDDPWRNRERISRRGLFVRRW